MKKILKKLPVQAKQKRAFYHKLQLMNASLAGLVLCSVNVVAQTTDIDQEVLNKPAYTLKIITHGEADNRSDNFTDATRQDNRRADVAMQATVPAGYREEKITTTEEQTVKVSDAINRSVHLKDGGVIWVSKDPASLTPILNVTSSQ